MNTNARFFSRRNTRAWRGRRDHGLFNKDLFLFQWRRRREAFSSDRLL
jgi:hypothetical protein